jgi:DNA repair exonuclease SbcCD ATPase subunit
LEVNYMYVEEHNIDNITDLKILYNGIKNKLEENDNMIDNMFIINSIETLKLLSNNMNNNIDGMKVINNMIEEYKKKLINDNMIDYKQYKNTSLELSNKLGIINAKINVENKNIEKKKEIYNLEKEIKKLEKLKNILLIEIPKIIIKKVLTKIENTINELITSVSPYTIRFEISDITTDKKILVKLEQLNDIDKILETCSGSEKFMIDLAIRASLCLFTKTNTLNCMFIDEGFTGFDIQKLDDTIILFDILNKYFDYIVIISHLERINNFANMNYTIKKDKNKSKVEIIDETINKLLLNEKHNKKKIKEIEINYDDIVISLPKKKNI